MRKKTQRAKLCRLAVAATLRRARNLDFRFRTRCNFRRQTGAWKCKIRQRKLPFYECSAVGFVQRSFSSKKSLCISKHQTSTRFRCLSPVTTAEYKLKHIIDRAQTHVASFLVDRFSPLRQPLPVKTRDVQYAFQWSHA